MTFRPEFDSQVDFILFYFIVGAKHEENETDGVKNLADQEHLSEENLFYIMVALKNAW